MHENETVNGIEFDPKGRIVLQYWDSDETHGQPVALLMRWGIERDQPFVVAWGYDKETGEWSQGNYYDNLNEARDHADPYVIEQATVTFGQYEIVDEIAPAMLKAGLDPTKVDGREFRNINYNVQQAMAYSRAVYGAKEEYLESLYYIASEYALQEAKGLAARKGIDACRNELFIDAVSSVIPDYMRLKDGDLFLTEIYDKMGYSWRDNNNEDMNLLIATAPETFGDGVKDAVDKLRAAMGGATDVEVGHALDVGVSISDDPLAKPIEAVWDAMDCAILDELDRQATLCEASTQENTPEVRAEAAKQVASQVGSQQPSENRTLRR